MTPSVCAVINGETMTSEATSHVLIDPADETPIGSVGGADEALANEAVRAASSAWAQWRHSTPASRAAALAAIADVLTRGRAEFAELESRNVGMPIGFAEAVVDASVDTLRFFAGAARSMSGVPAGEYVQGMTSMMRREPVGVVAAFVPWNVPLLMATWKIAPALAAGCSIVLRPSHRTPLSALSLAQAIAAEQAVPSGVVNVVTGSHERVVSTLVNHANVRLVALTGSPEAGRAIATLAAQRTARLHLELGGKTPVIVCTDADLDRAARVIAGAALDNAGQDCTAATRVLVAKEIHDSLVDRLADALAAVRIGHPRDPDTVLGPVIGADRREAILRAVEDSLSHGARVVLEPKVVGNLGWFLSPGLLTDVLSTAPIASTEVFGPIVTVERFDTVADAIVTANASPFALAAGIWTRSLARGLSIAAALDAGKIWVNEHHRDVTEMPHGGTKDSGYGSDLSMLALDHYTRPKAVHVALEEFE